MVQDAYGVLSDPEQKRRYDMNMSKKGQPKEQSENMDPSPPQESSRYMSREYEYDENFSRHRDARTARDMHRDSEIPRGGGAPRQREVPRFKEKERKHQAKQDRSPPLTPDSYEAHRWNYEAENGRVDELFNAAYGPASDPIESRENSRDRRREEPDNDRLREYDHRSRSDRHRRWEELDNERSRESERVESEERRRARAARRRAESLAEEFGEFSLNDPPAGRRRGSSQHRVHSDKDFPPPRTSSRRPPYPHEPVSPVWGEPVDARKSYESARPSFPGSPLRESHNVCSPDAHPRRRSRGDFAYSSPNHPGTPIAQHGKPPAIIRSTTER